MEAFDDGILSVNNGSDDSDFVSSGITAPFGDRLSLTTGSANKYEML